MEVHPLFPPGFDAVQAKAEEEAALAQSQDLEDRTQEEQEAAAVKAEEEAREAEQAAAAAARAAVEAEEADNLAGAFHLVSCIYVSPICFELQI